MKPSPWTTVLVSGGRGFHGGHMLRELRAAGCVVRALSRRVVTPEGAALNSHRLQVDCNRAVRELDYRITPLDLLLDDTIAWMRAQGMVAR